MGNPSCGAKFRAGRQKRAWFYTTGGAISRDGGDVFSAWRLEGREWTGAEN